MNKTNSFRIIFSWVLLVLFIPMHSAQAAPQCSDGVDNDGDRLIDALVELGTNNGQSRQWTRDPFGIRTFVNSKAAEFGFTRIPDSGALNYDAATAQKVCRLAGFSTVESRNCVSNYNGGRCGWYSCHDNKLGKWNASRNNFDILNACTAGNRWLTTLKCVHRLAQCRDGIDNDKDGRTDYPSDSGCASANDNSEVPHDQDCTNPSDDSEAPDSACADRVDNDNDGLIDMNDPGCYSPQDNSEKNISGPQCDNGLDDDRDGKVDYPADSDCSGPSDPTEGSTTPQCLDGIDNDNDGARDYPEDFSCSSATDTDESNPKAQCQDGIDNDRDGKTDLADPGCTSKQDNDESGDGGKQCSDGKDNDGDGLVDMSDPGCYAPHDNNERNISGPQCDNGIDDDADGKTDYPADSDCSSPTDTTEGTTGGAACQDGRDNDGDGATDFPADFSCSSPGDTDEANPKAQCQDGVDNDHDGKIDLADPGCGSKQDNDESNTVGKQCSDLTDNDGDGLIDMNDPGCYAPHDNNERNISGPQCDNGLDDDGDGKIDYPADNGCSGPRDPSEGQAAQAQCKDGLDNDHDGATDYPADFSCSSADDQDESNPKAQCQDGRDNDQDGRTDLDDAGCSSKQDNDESDDAVAQCHDGKDNDRDGLIDTADPGCYSPQDNDERNINGPQCDNGLDDDNDGYIDYPDDNGCTGPRDTSEGGGTGVPECRDGVDNDNDGKIDALVEDNGTGGGSRQWTRDPFGIRTFVNSKAAEFGFRRIPDTGALNYDAVTAQKVCDLAGFATVESRNCVSNYNGGRCGWYSCHDNTLGKWNPSKNDFDIYNACTAGNRWLTTLKCVGAKPACSDGKDNDGDGKTDYPNDLGCASANDTSEIPHDPDCSSPDDGSESSPVTGTKQCQNGRDDDRDGFVDMNDPGCYAPHDNNERNISGAQCDNGLDDDGDGRKDYPDDTGCTSPRDNDERPACTTCGTARSSASGGNSGCVCDEGDGPGAPKNLNATDGTSASYVKVTWDAVAGADSYQLYRSRYADAVGEPLGAAQAGTEYLDSSAVPGVDYYYTATASNSAGTSWFCNTDWGYRLGAAVVDSDGDGVSNAQEKLDGTDADDPGSFLLHLKSPAFTKYNTFLAQWNFLELVAGVSGGISGTVTVYLPDGNILAELPVAIAAGSQADVDVNGLIAQACEATALCEQYPDVDGDGLIDTYGVIRIDFAEAGEATTLTGRMSNYKQNADGSFSFAFARELRNPTRGKTFATANTYDPQGAGYLVPNWLEIINLDDEPQTFSYVLYNQEGAQVYAQEVTIAPLGEADLQAGHEITDAAGNVVESVYLAEIVPHDGAAPYFAGVSRYSSNAPAGTVAQTYNFAFALDAKAGNGTTQYLPINNETGTCYSQTNWVEVVNVREKAVNITVAFRNGAGEALTVASEIALAPKSQYHFNASALLPKGAIGAAEVQSSDKGALVTQSLVYFHDCVANQLQTAYASPGRIAGLAKQAGSVNTFLGMTSELRVVGAAEQASSVILKVRTFDVSADQTVGIELSAKGTEKVSGPASVLDVPADRYGSLALETSTQGRLVAEVLRVKPLSGGKVDFAMPTAVQ